MRWKALLAAVAVFGLATAADDKKDDKTFEFPDLEAKDWKKLENGMKVWDVKEGKGDEAKAKAKVKVNYTGWTTDGKKFDSSFDRKEPISFPLTGVIKGWTEGVPGMKPGGVRRLMIPSEMAYGANPPPRSGIPKDATLVFVIEYLGPSDDK